MMEHLTCSTAKWLDKPQDARIRAILVNKWVPYTLAQQVLKFLAFLQTHPSSSRMPNLMLVEDTGNGKTHLLEHYVKTCYSVHQQSTAGEFKQHQPVLYVCAPHIPDVQLFYSFILEKLHVPVALGARTKMRLQLVGDLLHDVGVRMLIVDEIQHVLAGSPMKQREVLNMLKLLANTVCIPLVFAGIRTANHVIQHDDQLKSRFERIELPAWSMDEEYLRLLDSLEQLLPLRFPSHLSEPQLASKLLALSKNTIGGLVNVLKRLAVNAVESNEERISLKQIKRLESTPMAFWISVDYELRVNS
ncbi:TniB family NTP-binding protein [Hymenobacter swuensis]|uniref:TniB family NTP-binding protein n=1 Tax=Hymenobacter swuensis TaxID=1446467 RepID=UPI00090069A2|nr:TniB family NTP-binding protein [Hymenobacter swuensis]